MSPLDLESLVGTDDPLLVILRGGAVVRYHAEGPVLAQFQQSVAEHTWRVQVILLHLFPDASLELFKAALYHDVPEGVFGDIRAPIKRMLNIKQDLDELERALMKRLDLPFDADLSATDLARLKVADYCELCMFIEWVDRRELAFIFRNGYRYAIEASHKLPDAEAQRVYRFLSPLERKMGRFKHG